LLNGANDPDRHSYDHLGLFGIDGHVVRVDMPRRDLRPLLGGPPVNWSPDSARLDAYGTIVSRDGRPIATLADVTIAAWSWDSHHLAVAGPASSRLRVVDADGSHRQEIGGPTAAQVDQLVWVP
jgi:hypothetical protein